MLLVLQQQQTQQVWLEQQLPLQLKGTASGQVTLYSSGSYTSPNYVYIKNTSNVTTNYISVFADTASDDPDLFYIPGGGFAIIPVTSGVTLKAYATVSGTIVEHITYGTEV